MPHVIRLPFQQGPEAGMVAEGVPGQFFTDEIRALEPGDLLSVGRSPHRVWDVNDPGDPPF